MLIFDLETNGLMHQVDTIHCLAIYDTETEETLSYNDTGITEPVVRGIQRLEDASQICGHNIIGYDIPVINKLFSWFTFTGDILDTLILSRIFYANILDIDKSMKFQYMPSQLYGRHSLESWGYRLKVYKGEFSQHTDWKDWSQEMEDYCIQDVNVTTKLLKHFDKKIDDY
ncbi:MAG: hypothetical protein CL779_02560 [Chloroflexi bacterium]|nr:hypothetical protein [Chloroflexota bacterium]